MSIFSSKRVILALGTSAAIVAAAPVVAQNIGYTDRNVVILNTAAFKNGLAQIDQLYAQNLQQMAQKEQEMGTLLAPLDANRDGDLSEQEIAAAPKATVDRVNILNGEMQQLQAPILYSRLYVVEQINTQYDPAQAAVVKAKKVSVILKPDALVYAPESADLTDALVAELDKTIPQVAITPPQGWQPQRRTVAAYQQIEEWLQFDAMLRQQQQQQQGAPAAPAPQPAADQGR